jgi:hypothetical protein
MKTTSAGLCAMLCLALAACANTTTKVEKKEDLLLASGFTIRVADTPKRQALLAKLPAHRFVQRSKDGKALFLYADPLVCDCLYIGDDKAFGKYQETILDRQMARDELGDQGSLREESKSDLNEELRVLGAEEAGWGWEPWALGW